MTDKMAYILVVDGEVDQVCETQRDCQREKLDLIAMGCSPKIIKCSWDKLDDVIFQIECGAVV